MKMMTEEAGGIIVVDKPAGFTSFDVVAKMRGICATRKIGHGGTLDPMATGVLPVFVGLAAKAVDLAPRQDKAYDAEVLFGLATDTGDVTGTVLEEREVDVDTAQLGAVLPRFVGKQQQTPPMYSAVKVNGKPLYRYAREGITVQRKQREITIHEIKLLEGKGKNRFLLHVHCSKGTYIRTLVEDVGRTLGVPATLAGLRRTQAGVFGLDAAHTLEEVQAAKNSGRLDELYRPVEVLFMQYPALEVDERAAARLLNGAAVDAQGAPNGRCRIVAEKVFMGLGQVSGGVLKGEKLFVRGRQPGESGG